jgi:hypothetical protein
LTCLKLWFRVGETKAETNSFNKGEQMKTQEKPMDIVSVGDGVVPDLFKMEQQKIIDNILDPNMKPGVKREFNLKVKYTPNKENDFVNIEVSSSVKLAPFAPMESAASIGKDLKGDGEIFELQRRKHVQSDLPDNVSSIDSKKEAVND